VNRGWLTFAEGAGVMGGRAVAGVKNAVVTNYDGRMFPKVRTHTETLSTHRRKYTDIRTHIHRRQL
jgi:hypothetical protein